jgi:transcriptional regulator with XRE-family HTH domain
MPSNGAALLRHRARMQVALGSACRQQRLARRLTQAEVAQAAGARRPLVTRLEGGRHEMSLGTFIRYALALGCSPAELMRAAEGMLVDEPPESDAEQAQPAASRQLTLPSMSALDRTEGR